MAHHGDYNINTPLPAANVNNNLGSRESQPSAHPIIIDVGDASSDSSRRSRHRSPHIQVTEGGRHGPRVEATDRRHHRYTYIPSTSSFSRENSPRTSVPPIIIQQPSQHRYSHASYHDTPFITSQPTHGAYDSPYYQPQPAYNVSPGYPPQPIPAGWPAGSSGHHQPRPPYDAQNIRIHVPYDRTSHYGAHSPTESVSQDAASAYIAVDPFRSSTKTSIISSSLPVAQGYEQHPYSSTPHYVVYPYTRRRTICFALLIDFFAMVFRFFFNTLPRQVYLNFLLRLPAFYFSRVARIFEEAEMTMPEIEKMALQGMDPIALQQLPWSSPSGANLKSTWEGFIDSLLREWKTLNIISVLLLSAILTILQIESAAADPVTRNAALFSLICALMSLLYGCMYIIRFSSMRKAYKALEWAQEAQKTKTLIWWNVWVLLAMPATWLGWSIMLYIACIMAFVWRSDAAGLNASANLSPHDKLSIRIAISVVLGLGVLYFALILNTLRLYGDSMDKNFKAEFEQLVREKKEERRHGHGSYYHRAPHHYNHSTSSLNPYVDPAPYATSFYDLPPGAPPGRYDYSLSGASSTASFFKTEKVMDLQFHQRGGFPMPDFLVSRGFKHEDWENFISEESQAWDGDAPLFQSRPFGSGSGAVTRPQDSAARILAKWNRKYFNRRKTMGLLCHEYIDHWPDSPTFAIYLVDISSPDGQLFNIADRFGPVPEGLTRIDIFDQPGRERSRRRILGRTSIFSAQNPVDGRVHFGGQVHERSPERRSRSSSPSSRSSSPYRPSGRRPSGNRRSRRSERTHRSRRSRSRSYSPRREVLPSWPPGFAPYYPTAVPPTTVIVVPQSPSLSSSSFASRRTPPPPPHRTDNESRAAVAEASARPRTKSEGDAFRPSGPSNSYERPIMPRTKSRRNTLGTQTTESEPDLLVFPPPSSHSSRRPSNVHIKGTEPSTSKPHENIVADDGDVWYQRSGTGADVLPPRRKSRRHSPGSNPRPMVSFTPAPIIVPQRIPPASEPSTANVRVKTPRGRPATHEAAVHELHSSPSPQSFKSFSSSPPRSTSPSGSVPPAEQPPSVAYDHRSQARFGNQRPEHPSDVDDQPAHGAVYGRGRSRERRARRSVDSERMAGQVGNTSPNHRQRHVKTKLPSRDHTPDPASSPTQGPLSALVEGPWTRDRSSLRTILAPVVDGNLGGASTS